ncbi:MAG: hypothetical protein K6T63_03490 [Alicyclobacillus herbarius]|uniref:hypothetical protein n=1 Tax=Alicyclobacillus herbarius TaxID=122960 RepID=UPI0004097B61|nr:hypothetical protein [Alicyclobacillus herbarius]MCL6631672.1 hypothetical protein [Alicyclobacillus herbarius]
MRRHRLHAIALILMWIGGIELVAGFLAKVWFEVTVQWTPVFFLALLVGIVLYVISRVL